MSPDLGLRRVAVAVLSLLLTALAVLLLLPSALPTARGIESREAEWRLPVAVTVSGDEAVGAITRLGLWVAAAGGPAAAAAADQPPLTPPDWRISGVYSEAGTPRGRMVVLVSTDGQPQPKELRVGDTLPGGARITAISPDRIGLVLNGRRVSLSTYPK